MLCSWSCPTFFFFVCMLGLLSVIKLVVPQCVVGPTFIIVCWSLVLYPPLGGLLSLLLDVGSKNSNLRRGCLCCPVSLHAHTGHQDGKSLSLPSSWFLPNHMRLVLNPHDRLPIVTCLGQLGGAPGQSVISLVLLEDPIHFLLHKPFPECTNHPSRWSGLDYRVLTLFLTYTFHCQGQTGVCGLFCCCCLWVFNLSWSTQSWKPIYLQRIYHHEKTFMKILMSTKFRSST